MTPLADRLRLLSDELASVADVMAALEAERDHYKARCALLTAELERRSERVEAPSVLCRWCGGGLSDGEHVCANAHYYSETA